MMGPPRMRILVLGATGQVGRELTRSRLPPGLAVAAPPRDALDLARADSVRQAIGAAACDLVVNAAAYTQVDRAETEREAAFAINRDGAAYLAEACRAKDVPLLHLSTDYVFDGTKTGAYTETDPVRPVGVYGDSKEAGERAVRDRLDRHIILRTAWVFSPFRHNFVKTMMRVGREREEIAVVDDQTGCPTAAAEIARAVLAIAERLAGGGFDRWGTYHFCGAGPTTWHGFAQAVFAALARYGIPAPRLRAIRTADYPTAARRPANSVLDCTRIGAVFGIVPRPWRKGLDACIAELMAAEERSAAR